MVTVFEENVNSLLPLLLYSGVMFVTETVLFQNKLQSTGLEPCQRLVINLKVSKLYDFAVLAKHFGISHNHTV